jgi:hypothetical protein
MNWKLKTNFFKLLSIFPDSLGDFFYHKIQEYGLASKFEMSFIENKRTFEIVKRILKLNNFEFSNPSVLEIGTGWFPFFPYMLIGEFENAKVLTVDLNHHMSPRNIKIVEMKMLNEGLIERDKINLNGQLNQRILYKPRTSILDINVNSSNLVFSRYVLEHIPPEIIERIHLYLYENLPDDSRILHLISPSDHRSYYDKNLSHVDFLKYSNEEWNKICTRFDYHNRLRINEYVAIFEKTGFKVEFIESDTVDVNSKKEKLYKSLKLDNRFQSFTDYQNVAGSINVLLKKLN